MRLQSLRGAPRPLIIEPQKRLKTEAESRFRANPDARDNRDYRGHQVRPMFDCRSIENPVLGTAFLPLPPFADALKIP